MLQWLKHQVRLRMQQNRAKFLKTMNTVEVESFLATEAPLFFPIGTLEAHGRHLPVGTDTICAEKIAEELSHCFSGAIAPSFEYGITNVLAQTSPASFFPEEMFADFIEKIIESFYLQGFKTIIIINGHGGNRDALKKIIRRQSRVHPIALSVINWWLISEHYVEQVYGTRPGGHAAVEETAVIQHFYPELVNQQNYTSTTDDYVADDGIWMFPPPGEVILHQAGQGQPDFDCGKSTALTNLLLQDLTKRLKIWLNSLKRLKGGLRP